MFYVELKRNIFSIEKKLKKLCFWLTTDHLSKLESHLLFNEGKCAYTGRLRPKGVPFSGFRYIKVEVYKRVGKSVILKGPLIIIFRIDAPYGFISLFFFFHVIRLYIPQLSMLPVQPCCSCLAHGI